MDMDIHIWRSSWGAPRQGLHPISGARLYNFSEHEAKLRPLLQQFMALYGLIWYSTSILGSWNSQWSMDRLSILGKCWISLRIACLQAHHEHEDLSSVISCHTHITPYHRKPIWLVVYLPLWKIWVRQWEGWHPIYYGKILQMLQATNQ
jgi:hypothetical protein